ncbi:MAG: hypothetical protein AB4038_01400 [Prochloraceae cyanobacterium]
MIKFLGIVLVISYFWGIWKFWRGYRRTNFSPAIANRLVLSLFWPVLAIANKSYRQNFQKALKG